MPSRFKVKIKFEMDIEGNREDIPLITHEVAQQVKGALAPASNIVEGEVTEVETPTALPASNPNTSTPAKRTRRKSKPAQPAEQSETPLPDWTHDETKYGNPKQEWVTATKSLWLLYVVSQETNTKQLTTGQITSIFNTKFRDAKMVQATNVTRDLKKLAKQPINPPIGKDGEAWYLTQTGEKQAIGLVAEALGKTDASDSGDAS